MTPEERARLEYTYDRLRQLYESGNIRPAEMDELYRIDEAMRPTWTAETAEAKPEQASMTPTAYDPAADLSAPQRSLGSRVGNEDLAAGRALALDPAASMYSLLDPEGRYADTPIGYFNQAVMRAPDLALGGLLALFGGAQKAAGYGSDILGLGLQPGDIPNLEEASQVADALYALPTARMAGAISGAASRSAADTGLGIVDDVQQGYRSRQLPDGYAYLTHEAVPYRAVGSNVIEGEFGVDAARMLPGVEGMTPAQLAAFSADPRRSWINPETGGDILSEAVGARTLPTLQGQGVYDGPRGTEFNPLAIGRSYAAPEQLQATESLRGLLDVQGATPWTRLAAGELPTVFLPKARPGTVEEMARLKEVGEPYGLTDVVDVGEGYILTNYMGGAVDAGREARRALEKASGLKAVRTTAESGYPGYEKAWEKGGGAAIRRYLENVEAADPAALAALENSATVRQAAANRAAANFQQAGELGGANKTAMEIQRTVQRGGEWTPKLEAYADRLERARIPPQLPVLRFPEPSPLSVTHISPEARDVLDPFKAFTNPRMRGAEQQLDPSVYPKQTYFGVGVGQPGGYVPEGALGRVTHEAELPQERLLDISQGWGDIEAEADALVARRGPLTQAAADSLKQAAMMRIAKMRGYEGLYNPSHSLGPIATSFYEITPTRTGLLE